MPYSKQDLAKLYEIHPNTVYNICKAMGVSNKSSYPDEFLPKFEHAQQLVAEGGYDEVRKHYQPQAKQVHHQTADTQSADAYTNSSEEDAATGLDMEIFETVNDLMKGKAQEAAQIAAPLFAIHFNKELSGDNSHLKKGFATLRRRLKETTAGDGKNLLTTGLQMRSALPSMQPQLSLSAASTNELTNE
ncbi:hypothetical protein IQ268_09040 [Oculatella sp. LEGE 06141]|uniref:hypothetical protein n=1 Tax=Oculatella sp. LEGE 06141 TaxID=1828648 RepID=UPI001882063D|nr:hypothetical protein [Oculatella sp. LEGE 06141]MBE9178704.1 hypothetical protein [Oculatella sp. LEGE 06141]